MGTTWTGACFASWTTAGRPPHPAEAAMRAQRSPIPVCFTMFAPLSRRCVRLAAKWSQAYPAPPHLSHISRRQTAPNRAARNRPQRAASRAAAASSLSVQAHERPAQHPPSAVPLSQAGSGRQPASGASPPSSLDAAKPFRTSTGGTEPEAVTARTKRYKVATKLVPIAERAVPQVPGVKLDELHVQQRQRHPLPP